MLDVVNSTDDRPRHRRGPQPSDRRTGSRAACTSSARPARARSSSATQGITATAATTPHCASAQRQPAASATGIGDERRKEGADGHRRHVHRRDEPDAVGEVLLHQRRQHDVADRRPRRRSRRWRRAACPRSTPRRAARATPTSTTIATTSSRSSPSRRASSGVSTPKIAKHTGGALPSRPSATGEMATSSLNALDQRRERGDGAAQVERDEQDAGERERPPAPQRARRWGDAHRGTDGGAGAVTTPGYPRPRPGTPPTRCP